MTPDSSPAMIKRNRFVCPTCKGDLVALRCLACRTEYQVSEDVPCFLPRGGAFETAEEIGSTYDTIYASHSQTWEDQGREEDFRQFFADLASGLSTQRLLEIGCGEGALLQRLRATEKYAVDTSWLVLKRAKTRTGATCAAAVAEMLPFADETFDLAVSVGVMEHFLDEDKANREIYRVLKRGGHYLVLIHLYESVAQRLRRKIREYLFPRPRPLRFIKWLKKKAVRPIHQPIQHDYTIASARECLERSQFVVKRTISRGSDPAMPLAGDHVVIYVAQRAA